MKQFKSTMKIVMISIMLFSMSTIYSNAQENDGWLSYSEVDGVELLIKIIQCGENSESFVAVKAVNGNDQTVQVAYSLMVPSNPTRPPLNGEISIDAGESVEGVCGEPLNLTFPIIPEGDLTTDQVEITAVITLN